MKMRFVCLLLLVIASFCISCKKDAKENPQPDSDGNVPVTKLGAFKLELQHVVNGETLKFYTDYVNSSDETFQVVLLKYYVSNIKFHKPDGSIVSLANTYYLVDMEADADQNGILIYEIPHLPEGNYSAVSFVIGVDSVRTESSGAQTGDLSPEKGMYRVLDGYTAFHFEGTCPQLTSLGKNFNYGVMGYKGRYNALQTVKLDFGGALLMAKPNAVPILHLSVELAEFFKNPHTISIVEMPTSPSTADSVNVAISKNYADMYRFEHIHN